MGRLLSIITGTLLASALAIMCLPTWRTRWFGSKGYDHVYTYHRWFAPMIGYFDVASLVAMLLTVGATVATVVCIWRRRISWSAVGLNITAAVFTAAFCYSDREPSRAVDAGLWVAPLLGLAMLVLLVGKIVTRRAPAG